MGREIKRVPVDGHEAYRAHDAAGQIIYLLGEDAEASVVAVADFPEGESRS